MQQAFFNLYKFSEIKKQFHVKSWLTYRSYSFVWWILSCMKGKKILIGQNKLSQCFFFSVKKIKINITYYSKFNIQTSTHNAEWVTKDKRMSLQKSFYPNVNLHCNFFPSYVWYYAVGQSILKSTSQIPKWISLQLTIRPDLDVSWEGLPRDKQYLRKKNVVIFLDSGVKAD